MGLLTETRDIVKELKDNGVKAYMFFTEFEKKQTFYTKSRALGSR
jgi:hypothetical protein